MRVSKWGNSLAVRLPRVLVDELGLRPGDALDVVAARGRELLVAKADARAAALARMASRGWPAPAAPFDRAALHERGGEG